MPAEDIQSWSTTAATNATADTGINWAEGQPRASVNNSARSMMAAHAKERNLQNGSIVTGGTANAQTFTSGVTYTSVPTGLWVRLKVGFTNTGAATLNMDGIGAVAIKDQFGADLGAGALITGQYVELLYNGTNWILLLLQSAVIAAPQCGRLDYVSATALSFKPYNGDRIKINGVIYAIPSAGIAGLANTGVVVNSTPGQNLAANTLYYVYAIIVGGVITGNFTTAGHVTSTTPGNVGVEVVTGAGGDTNTLIGMIFANASAQFQDANQFRWVISWFNRRRIAGNGPSTAGVTTTSTTPVELAPSARVNFLVWAGEAVGVSLVGTSQASPVPSTTGSTIGIDGAATGAFIQASLQTITGATDWGAHSGTNWQVMSEGNHFITPLGYNINAFTGAFHVAVFATIRG